MGEGTGAEMKIAIVAASSVVPEEQLLRGADRLRAEGFDVSVDPQCLAQHFTYAGEDAGRAQAFWGAANDPSVDVIWAARGGYGAARLLPILDELTAAQGVPPRKLLVGYSDVTVLHEFVRAKWGWATLHAPMPASANFGAYDAVWWKALIDLVNQKHPGPAWGKSPLTWIASPPGTPIAGQLIGGNLALWASAIGTPSSPTPASEKILFLEDVGERFYRIDRMITQVRQAGLLEGALAIVLGDFTDCSDDPPRMIRSSDGIEAPLRPKYEWADALREIFATLGLPVAVGLPVGHGPGFAPLPLGARYRLDGAGAFELTAWSWLGG